MQNMKGKFRILSETVGYTRLLLKNFGHNRIGKENAEKTWKQRRAIFLGSG